MPRLNALTVAKEDTLKYRGVREIGQVDLPLFF